MESITKKRKPNQDEVVERICECIGADDAAPFYGDVDTWVDLQDQSASWGTRADNAARQCVIRGLVAGVKEAWFNEQRASRLLEELLRRFESPQANVQAGNQSQLLQAATASAAALAAVPAGPMRPPQPMQAAAALASPNQPNNNLGTWTQHETDAFRRGLQLHGKNWKKIQPMIQTRTLTQIRSHAQKYFAKLGRDQRKQDHVQYAPEGGSETAEQNSSVSFRDQAYWRRVSLPPPACCRAPHPLHCAQAAHQHLSHTLFPRPIANRPLPFDSISRSRASICATCATSTRSSAAFTAIELRPRASRRG